MELIKKIFLKITQAISLYRNVNATISLAKTAIKENQKLRNEIYLMKKRLQDMDRRALDKTYEGFKITEINENTSLVWVTSSDPDLITENNFSHIRNALKEMAPHVNIVATRHADIKLLNKMQIKKLIEELNESIQAG